jgi:hypothetical protein
MTRILDSIPRTTRFPVFGASSIILPDVAHIENVYAIPPAACDLSLDGLRLGITTWLEFLESEAKGRSRRADDGSTA